VAAVVGLAGTLENVTDIRRLTALLTDGVEEETR
jgi:hypothetical protein